MSDDKKINWGAVLGGVAAVTGAAVAGVGAAEALDVDLGDNAVGNALGTAGDKVTEVGAKAAEAVGADVKGSTAAMVAGGTLAAAGVAGAAASIGHDGKDEDEEKIKEAKRKMRMMEAQQGVDIDGDGVIGGGSNLPQNGRDDERSR